MERVRIKIEGIVQGIGFRPFVHRLVEEFGLAGGIRNTSSGVELELEGDPDNLRRFVEVLPQRAPRLAVIESIRPEYGLAPKNEKGFTIYGSLRENERDTLISPDIAICEDCARELKDPADRRYRYPFINCTNCGPRFTIIKDVPYDRANTTMARFPMCDACSKEYKDIRNRRYHAQPDCCFACGPGVFFLNENGAELPGDAIETARTWLKEGKIIAVKGLGGIHLACECTPETAKRLRKRKHRDEKPFAVMCRNVACAREICEVSEEEEALLLGIQHPIVLLQKKTRGSLLHLSENNSIGVMLPYTPLHILLFGEDIDRLIMTSANISETPILTKNEEAVEKLHRIADGFLLHNREIETPCDDSLIRIFEGKNYPLRRSRGYVPLPLFLRSPAEQILACGAEQKASFSLSKGQHVFQSQHIGDLKNIETYQHYSRQIRHFEHMFDLKPEAVVCDLHPDYLSTQYAQERAEADGIPLLQVQHHHAHLASCMADNGLEGRVLGLIWDGTGLGSDGSSWGAECLLGGYAAAERIGSIRKILLPGGDLVTKELTRTAYSLLRESGCEKEEIPGSDLLGHMLERKLNCPASSGMGRLFDGVAAILGIKTVATYEGQGAILLETAAEEDCTERYSVAYDDHMVFDWRPMIREIVSERNSGKPAGRLAAKFMNTLVQLASDQCREGKRISGESRVVLSGGTFQNIYLLARIKKQLESDGFTVYRHCRVSANDEGISLGQLMIAAELRKQGRG